MLALIIPILQIRKVRLRELEQFAKTHRINKQVETSAVVDSVFFYTSQEFVKSQLSTSTDSML